MPGRPLRAVQIAAPVVTALTAVVTGFTALRESGTPCDQQLVAWTSARPGPVITPVAG